MPANSFEILHMPPQNTNSVLVSGGGLCVIFDPWGRADDWDAVLRERGLKLHAIYATHGHPDHISAAAELARRHKCAWYMRASDNFLIGWGNDLLAHFGLPSIAPDAIAPTDLPYGDVNILPGMSAQIIECPGHTPGGVAYLFADAGVLIIGDTIFQDSIGRYDLPGGDLDALCKTIGAIVDMNLSPETVVIHGHGMHTTIGYLKQNNPYFK